MSTNANNRGCLTAIMGLFGQKPQPSDVAEKFEAEEELPYRVRDDFASPAELSFYHVLELAVQSRVTILSKVRLADVFFVAQPNQNRKYFNSIVGKHIDFLLCDPATLKPLAGIELDDASHERSDRVERDDFVNRVFASAGLPLLHFPTRRTYKVEDIEIAINEILPPPPTTAQNLTTSSRAAALMDSPNGSAELDARTDLSARQSDTSGQPPLCPKCQIPMVMRTVSNGEHKGKQFWGCSNYPNCRQVKPV